MPSIVCYSELNVYHCILVDDVPASSTNRLHMLLATNIPTRFPERVVLMALMNLTLLEWVSSVPFLKISSMVALYATGMLTSPCRIYSVASLFALMLSTVEYPPFRT